MSRTAKEYIEEKGLEKLPQLEELLDEYTKHWLKINLPTKGQLDYQFKAGHLVDHNRTAGAEWLLRDLCKKAGF